MYLKLISGIILLVINMYVIIAEANTLRSWKHGDSLAISTSFVPLKAQGNNTLMIFVYEIPMFFRLNTYDRVWRSSSLARHRPRCNIALHFVAFYGSARRSPLRTYFGNVEYARRAAANVIDGLLTVDSITDAHLPRQKRSIVLAVHESGLTHDDCPQVLCNECGPALNQLRNLRDTMTNEHDTNGFRRQNK